MRENFEQHADVQDAGVLDVLLHKGRQDLQECLNAWQQVSRVLEYSSTRYILIQRGPLFGLQEPHILGILLAPKTRPQQTFMQKFLAGEPSRLHPCPLLSPNVTRLLLGRDEEAVIPATPQVTSP